MNPDYTYCGDGEVQTPNANGVNEQCDDGNNNETDSCLNNCTLNPDYTYCGDGEVQTPNANGENEQCDDGNNNETDSCLSNCTFNPDYTYCGDGEVQTPNANGENEQCDDGNNNETDSCLSNCTFNPDYTYCGDGEVQTPNSNGENEQCDDRNFIDGDGCSSTCQTEGGGGGGGSDVNPTIGICGTDGGGALQCIPEYPYEDVDDQDYQDYRNCENDSSQTIKDCLILWAHATGKTYCGDEIEGMIQIPFTGSFNADISAQCGEIPPGGGNCQDLIGCPSCFLDAITIKKEVAIQETSPTFFDRIFISKETETRYKITLDIEIDETKYFVSSGEMFLFDYSILQEGNGIWERVAFIDETASGLIESIEDHDHGFGMVLSDLAIDILNTGSLQLEIEYNASNLLAPNSDIATFANVAFARGFFSYQERGVWVNEDVEFIVNGLNSLAVCDTPIIVEDPSTLGAIATVHIIRPFIEAKKGGNIGFELEGSTTETERLTGNKENIVTGSTTSGKIFVKEDQSFLFDYAESLIQTISDFANIKDFQEGNDKDVFFANLKQNAFENETIFGSSFKTTSDEAGIYFLETGDLLLNGSFDAEDQSKTFVIEGGNLVIDGDFEIQNGIAAFIIRNGGNIIIKNTVTDIEGIFIVEQGGEIVSDDISDVQLQVNGALMGNMTKLLENRIYIGTLPINSNDELEPNIKINFDLRLLENTPPGLELFLGEDWRETVQ